MNVLEYILLVKYIYIKYTSSNSNMELLSIINKLRYNLMLMCFNNLRVESRQIDELKCLKDQIDRIYIKKITKIITFMNPYLINVFLNLKSMLPVKFCMKTFALFT